jgi:pyruvate ferredoxin oxidoreductase gamma subunit
MFQIRIHGRGGQGVVTAAELLSMAAFAEGAWAQAFPSFGSERTGAPVAAFCRFSDRPIRTREPIATPDCVIVQDPTLTGHVDLLAGLRPGGWVLVNSTGPATVGADHATVLTVPATKLALQYIGKPVPNAALLGGFAALTGRLRLESVLSAIRERFPARLAEGNVAAAEMAYRIVRADAGLPAGAALRSPRSSSPGQSAQREEYVDA